MNNKFYDIGFYKVDEKVFFNEGIFSMYFFSVFDVVLCNNSFYIYEDNYWKIKSDLEIKKLCKDCFDSIEIGVWKLNHENKYFPTIKIDATSIQDKTLNKYPHKLNFQNGVYDFKNLSFEEHSKDDYFTYILDFPIYQDIMPTPYFDSLLKTLSNGDKELDDFLRRLTAYLISGLRTEQRFYVIRSSGNSGKSTYINLLTKILTQDFVASIPLNKLEDRFALSEAVGKKLIISAENESNEKSRIKTSTLKSISGGDILRVEKKYKDAYSDRLNVELLFATNSDSLVFEDLSEGLKRRITVIETSGVVKEKIIDFDEQLEKEIPFIMTKLINVFLKEIANNGFKLHLCESVVLASEKAILNSTKENVRTTIGEEFINFFEETLIHEPSAKLTKKKIYDYYQQSGGTATTTKFWIRFDRWTTYKNYKIQKTNAPNREIIGINFRDNSIDNVTLADLF